MSFHILVNLTTIDVQMYNLGLLSICFSVARNTIRETHAYSYQHVTFLLFQVDSIVAMHAQHSDIQRVVRRKGRESQHGATSRDIGFLQECFQIFLSITKFYPLSNKSQRFLSIIN